MNQPISYSCKDAAEATSLSMAEIYRAIREGSIKAKKHGRRVLIPYDSLMEFVNSLEDWELKS